MSIGMLGLIGLVAVALGYFVSPIFFYIIGGVIFTPFTRFALHGNTEVLVAPIVFVIGGLLWPLVASCGYRGVGPTCSERHQLDVRRKDLGQKTSTREPTRDSFGG